MDVQRQLGLPKPTADQILLIYLAELALREGDFSRNATVLTRGEAPEEWEIKVTPHVIEYKLETYAVERFGKRHRGSTYLRRFRQARSEGRLTKIGVTSITANNQKNVHEQTVWTVRFSRDDFFDALESDDSPLLYGPQSRRGYDAYEEAASASVGADE